VSENGFNLRPADKKKHLHNSKTILSASSFHVLITAEQAEEIFAKAITSRSHDCTMKYQLNLALEKVYKEDENLRNLREEARKKLVDYRETSTLYKQHNLQNKEKRFFIYIYDHNYYHFILFFDK
jgi:hypothetical protein